MAEKPFKVWMSSILNFNMEPLPDELIGKMIKLGVRTANKGKDGVVKFKSLDRLGKIFKVQKRLGAAEIKKKIPGTQKLS